MSAWGKFRFETGRGVYDTPRASALSGVPPRTLHHWAHEGIYRPSISPDTRTRLWSWADLLAVRAIHWLRRTKKRRLDRGQDALARGSRR